MTEYNSDREAGLILKNMGLVVSIAKRFNPKTPTELDDYIQAGSIGLIKAIRSYDETKAVLSTWAYKHIKWEIIRYIETLAKRKELFYSHTEFLSIPDESHTLYSSNENSIITEYLPDSLTQEEKEVIILTVAGYKAKEIRDILNLPNTYSLAKIFKLAIIKIKKANNFI